MLINKSFQTEQGTVKFEGELEEKELDLVIQIGLNYLLQTGALPFVADGDEEDDDPISAADLYDAPGDLQ